MVISRNALIAYNEGYLYYGHWVTIPCSFVAGYQYFIGLYCLRLQGLQVEAVCTSKRMLTAYKTAWCHNTEDYSSHTQVTSIITQYTTSVADITSVRYCVWHQNTMFLLRLKGCDANYLSLQLLSSEGLMLSWLPCK